MAYYRRRNYRRSYPRRSTGYPRRRTYGRRSYGMRRGYNSASARPRAGQARRYRSTARRYFYGGRRF